MCGIVCYAGKNRAVPVLIDGLERLEYRGYDSAGISFYEDGKLKVIKKKGRLEALKQELAGNLSNADLGIGHTRWATHGEPNDVNSHPHLSSNSLISVVHNGIIENYEEIKMFLIKNGYVFFSDTDTEVISNLIEYHYKGDFLDAVRHAIKELKGAYALGVMCVDYPDRIIAARKDSPLIIGLGEGENFAASDIPAIIKYTKNIIVLEDNDIAVILKDGVSVYDSMGQLSERRLLVVDWDVEAAEKGGFEHFMLKEICDEPSALRACLNRPEKFYEGMVLNADKINKIWLIACGTAYHACLAGKYLIEKLAGISAEAELASEFRYRDPVTDNKDLAIIVSQSGETLDTLFALREARKRGLRILSVVNVVGSSIARESDYVFYTYAGPEIAVASTKAYNNQLAALIIIALRLAKEKNTVSDEKYLSLISEAARLPGCIEQILNRREEIQKAASSCFNAKSIFYIGRGLDYALSMEGSLKLKEISYIHSEAYAGGELKHGTIALIEQGTIVIAAMTQDSLFEKMEANIREVKARGAKVIAILPEGKKLSTGIADIEIRVPDIYSLFMPAAAVTIMQLFAYYVAVLRGNDVDKPRNLAKSVTVE